jgi:hypothetical protein
VVISISVRCISGVLIGGEGVPFKLALPHSFRADVMWGQLFNFSEMSKKHDFMLQT